MRFRVQGLGLKGFRVLGLHCLSCALVFGHVWPTGGKFLDVGFKRFLFLGARAAYSFPGAFNDYCHWALNS